MTRQVGARRAEANYFHRRFIAAPVDRPAPALLAPRLQMLK